MYGNQQYPQVVHKKHSFFSMAVLGLSAVTVTLLACVTMITMYGLRIVDSKTGDIFEFAEQTVHSLPELIDALPPILADVVNDVRSPEYLEQIDVSVHLTDGAHSRRGPFAVVTVHNRGDKVVSLMSMRIVVSNKHGEPIAEVNEWAATPIAADHDWRGPLLPGSERRFSVSSWHLGKHASAGNLTVGYEVTDVRVWNRSSTGDTALADIR